MTMVDAANAQARRQHWHANLRVTAMLLFIWFMVSFMASYFARELSFNFFGWPFSFWVAAQGGLVVYCLIVWFYAHYMSRLDARYGFEEPEE